MINERRSLREININRFFEKKTVYSFVLKKNFWTSFLLRQQILARPSSLQRRLLYFLNNHFSTRFYFLRAGDFKIKLHWQSLSLTSLLLGKAFRCGWFVESRFWLSFTIHCNYYSLKVHISGCLFVALVHVCSFYPHITVTSDPIHRRCLVFCKLKINLSKTFIHQERLPPEKNKARGW